MKVWEGKNLSNDKSRGAAIAEFVIIFPFLVLLLVFILDFGSVLYGRLALQQIAYEIARSGTRLTALESQVKTNGTVGETCMSAGHAACCANATNCPSDDNMSIHDLLMQRARLMIDQSEIKFYPTGSYSIQTNINISADTFEVIISGTPQSLWSRVGINIPIRARALAPWLR